MNIRKLHEQLDKLLEEVLDLEGTEFKYIMLPRTVTEREIEEKYPEVRIKDVSKRTIQDAMEYIKYFCKEGNLYAIRIGFEDKWLIGGFLRFDESLQNFNVENGLDESIDDIRPPFKSEEEVIKYIGKKNIPAWEYINKIIQEWDHDPEIKPLWKKLSYFEATGDMKIFEAIVNKIVSLTGDPIQVYSRYVSESLNDQFIWEQTTTGLKTVHRNLVGFIDYKYYDNGKVHLSVVDTDKNKYIKELKYDSNVPEEKMMKDVENIIIKELSKNESLNNKFKQEINENNWSTTFTKEESCPEFESLNRVVTIESSDGEQGIKVGSPYTRRYCLYVKRNKEWVPFDNKFDYYSTLSDLSGDIAKYFKEITGIKYIPKDVENILNKKGYTVHKLICSGRIFYGVDAYELKQAIKDMGRPPKFSDNMDSSEHPIVSQLQETIQLKKLFGLDGTLQEKMNEVSDELVNNALGKALNNIVTAERTGDKEKAEKAYKQYKGLSHQRNLRRIRQGKSDELNDIINKDSKYLEPLTEDSNLDLNVRNWYMKEFPTDDLGKDIPNWLTFKDIEKGIKIIYDLLAPADDSIVRERVFEKLAELKGVDYDVIYSKWINETLNESNLDDMTQCVIRIRKIDGKPTFAGVVEENTHYRNQTVLENHYKNRLAIEDDNVSLVLAYHPGEVYNGKELYDMFGELYTFDINEAKNYIDYKSAAANDDTFEDDEPTEKERVLAYAEHIEDAIEVLADEFKDIINTEEYENIKYYAKQIKLFVTDFNA